MNLDHCKDNHCGTACCNVEEIYDIILTCFDVSVSIPLILIFLNVKPLQP